MSESHAEKRLRTLELSYAAAIAQRDRYRTAHTKLEDRNRDLLTEQDALREALRLVLPWYEQARRDVWGLTKKMSPENAAEYRKKFHEADEALVALPTPKQQEDERKR